MRNILFRILDLLSFGYFNDFRNRQQTKNKIILIKKFGLEVLYKLHEISEEKKCSLWLEFGTMLGAYREHTFVKGDYDIDIGMYYEEYSVDFENALIMNGFKKRHFFYQYRKSDFLLTEVTWEYNGFTVDIFLNIKQEGLRYIYCYGKKDDESLSRNMWQVLEYKHSLAKPLQKIQFEDIECNIPAKVEECLTNYYGDDFMIPKQNTSATDKTERPNIYDISEAYASIYIVNY